MNHCTVPQYSGGGGVDRQVEQKRAKWISLSDTRTRLNRAAQKRSIVGVEVVHRGVPWIYHLKQRDNRMQFRVLVQLCKENPAGTGVEGDQAPIRNSL
jgi:hypothetical protein